MATGLNPFNLNKLLSGAPRVLFAPTTAPVVDNLSDIFVQVGPDYLPVSPWLDFGIAIDSSTYERDMDSEEITIQQQTGAVVEEITEVARTLEVDIGEITPEHMKIIEEGRAIATVAASAPAAPTKFSAQKTMQFGSIDDLTPYRVALVGRRRKGIGSDVTEAPNANFIRGTFVAAVFHVMRIAAEGAELEMEQGSAAHVPCTFKAYPESTISDPKAAVGLWIEEQAGTLVT